MLAWALWKLRDAGPVPASVGRGGGGDLRLGRASAFDFVWHIPAIPLVAAALAGLVLPPPDSEPDPSDQASNQPTT